MSKPVVEWTEDDVLSLPSGENDAFERKGTRLLDLTVPGVREGDVRDELAKQLSAFANTGGGQVVYGLNNDGTVDSGGVARISKGRQSTKEWLEDVIPNLTDFEIIGFNVHEIKLKPSGSTILPDRSLFVVDIPDSERAPHQSKRDLKYYIRLAGKSHPASHRIIEDIRNRARHPRIEIHGLEIVAGGATTTPRLAGLKSEFELMLGLQFGVRNVGNVRAASSCIQLSGTIPVRVTQLLTTEHLFRPSDEGTTLIELTNPLYPGMGIMLKPGIAVPASVQILPVGESLTLAGLRVDEAELVFTIFADNAPAHEQRFLLNEIDHQKRFAQILLQQVGAIRESREMPFLGGGTGGPNSWMS
jgi:hypothetical protein